MPAFMKLGDIKGEATDTDQRIDDGAITPRAGGDEALRLSSTIVAPADGDTEARAGHKDEIHIESFSWGATQSGGSVRSSFEADFLGGVFVGSDAQESLPGGVSLAVGDVDGDGVANHEVYLTYKLTDTLISG